MLTRAAGLSLLRGLLLMAYGRAVWLRPAVWPVYAVTGRDVSQSIRFML